jgi:GTPase involved in cell partitioning and DNA repair
MAPERHVKIADYPFTTLKPQVFDINFDEKDAEKVSLIRFSNIVIF